MLRTIPIAIFTCLLTVILGSASGAVYEPMVLVYVGDMPGYGESLAGIINQTGTRALNVESEAALLSMINLPQTRCVVITGFTAEDFAFLRRSTPVLVEYFREGGSLVGIGPACSSVQVDILSEFSQNLR